MAEWSYDSASHRYRNDTTGRYVSEAAILKLRDEVVAKTAPAFSVLNARLVDGSLTVGQWERATQRAIATAYLDEYLFGRGGRNVTTKAEYEELAKLVTGQFGYLRGFAEAVRDGKLSAAQIEVRSHLYVQSARQAFERGRAKARDIELPGYPGDGSTRCRTRCRCRWDIRQTKAGYVASWVMQASAEHCADCVARSAAWHELRFEADDQAAA